jgi:hypothetical protein
MLRLFGRPVSVTGQTISTRRHTVAQDRRFFCWPEICCHLTFVIGDCEKQKVAMACRSMCPRHRVNAAVVVRVLEVLEIFMMFWILFWFMIILLIGATPVWPHSRSWGYYPTSGFSLLLLIFLCIWMFGGFASFGHQGWWGGAPVHMMNR